MSSTLLDKDSVQTEEKSPRRPGGWLLILLICFLILFLMTSAILGSRLYEMATRDKYTVDLGLGQPESEIELFRIEYTNQQGEITVQGVNGENVVAPGTTVTYDIRLRNNEDVIIDFLMEPAVEFLSGDIVPIQFKIVDDYGNYILGSENEWVGIDSVNGLYHKGSIHPGEVFTYHLTWQWVFELDEEQNAYDTYLGNLDGEILPGIRLSIETDAVANPTPPKSNTHMAHLLGEGLGCCWCCYLVWLLVLICLVFLLWIWKLRKKIDKLNEIIKENNETADLTAGK